MFIRGRGSTERHLDSWLEDEGGDPAPHHRYGDLKELRRESPEHVSDGLAHCIHDLWVGPLNKCFHDLWLHFLDVFE